MIYIAAGNERQAIACALACDLAPGSWVAVLWWPGVFGYCPQDDQVWAYGTAPQRRWFPRLQQYVKRMGGEVYYAPCAPWPFCPVGSGYVN